MEVVLGSEVRFYEGNTIDPQRCVIAMTDAPLHSSLTDALPSAGFVAFPESANFSDRIIKWSAIGEKMYLEERSLMNSNVCSSVSLDFMRTGIIPGTSFEMFEKENILSLVVPTQSTVHRFSIPLSGREMGPSILSRLNDNLLLDNYHTSHPFLSEGRPVRASVAQHYQKTTIAYCDAEGRVSVVTLLENGQKHEEVILNNAGFFDRLMGENVELSSDVCALRSLKNVDLQKHTSRLNILSDIIISVTKNGWLRAWNAENRRACAKAIDLNARNFFMSAKPEDSDDDEEYKNQLKDVTYSIKGKIIDGSYFLTVSALKISTGSTAIHLIKLQKDVFTYLGSFDKYAFVGQVDKLIDFVTLEIDSSSSQDEEMDGAINREFILTGLWLNGKCGSSKDYVIRRARFGLNLNENLLTKHTEWFEVGPFENSPNDVADDVELDDTEESDWKNEKSLEELRDSVFNLDKRHFNTVWRAAQIQCSGYKQLVLRSGNWSALAKYIEGFLDSPQFVQQYQLKTSSKLRLNKNSGDITNEAQKKFWQDLVNACEQFEQGPRKPYALANIQSGTDVAITAVIHETYFTIISDYNEDLYQSLLSKSEGLTSQSFLCVELLGLLQAVRPTALKLINSLKKQKSSGGRRSCEVSLDASQKRQAKLFGSKINDLTTKFVELAGGAKEKVFSPPYQCVFGGSLTQSMVGGRMKLGIESRLLLAATLKLLKGSMEFTEIDVKLDGLLEDYVLLSNLADLNIVRDCAKVSLITWLPSDPEGLAMVRNEGGFAKDEATIKYDFTTYINQTVQAGIRALLPASETFVLPKKLVATRNFKILMKVLHLLSENSGPEMKPALAFFQGVAYCGTDVPIRAMEQFESAHQQLLEGNRSVRKAVLALVPMSVIPPDGQDPVDSITSAEFYFTTIKFLQEYKHSDQVVRVAARSIDQLPADSPTMAKIASTLYSHLTSKMEWTNAFKLVVKTSGTDKTPQIRELLSLMIYKGAWEQLASMSYGRYEDVVEDFLRDAAARQSPQEPRHLYELLFSYYVSRQEYRLAAVSMYAFAKHIENAEVMTRELLKKKRAALAAVLNMQSVVGMKPADNEMALDDFEDTSLVFPECLDDISMTDSDGSSSKRTSPVSSEGSDTCLVPEADDDEVPESKFSLAGRKKVVIVTQEEVEKEFVVANARVNLSNCPTHKGAPPTEPEELSRLLIENLLFDSAFDILRAFQLDTYDLFFAMTREAILIDSVGDREILGVIASTAPNAWTRQNRRHCNIMDGSEEHWDIVRGILKDTPDDSSALRAICTAFLSHKLDVPSWLHVEYTNYDVNDYLRCLIDYARYSSALGLICHVIDDENSKLTSTNARTCLPYGNINEVLVFTKKIEEESENGEDIIMLRKIVEEKLKSYFTRLQSLEKAVKLTQISSS